MNEGVESITSVSKGQVSGALKNSKTLWTAVKLFHYFPLDVVFFVVNLQIDIYDASVNC